MKALRIAKELELPASAAVTQTFACIGRKGAGKTYLATLLAEQMLDAEAQVIVLDPVGNWFGLRVDADGKSKGKDIFVLGGEHGDVPINPEGGERIARFLVEKNVSAVLDVSGFRQGERKRFATALGEELFHLKKKQRTPVHLFLEEAQVFAPQRAGPDEARMLGAFEAIVRLGRNYGIGCTMVTQRPQSVNKEVLSQVECLCVLQVNGAHERKALEEWVQEAGADRKLVGELPGLPQGEGYVWSPSWLKTFKRVRFGKKTTFDASATPELGKAAKAATLAAVDVDALRTDLAEVVKEAEADDPKALRRRVAELERELAKKPAPVAAKEKRVEVPIVKDAQVTALAVSVERLSVLASKFVDLAGNLRDALARAKAPPPPGLRHGVYDVPGAARALGVPAAALAKKVDAALARTARPTKPAAGEVPGGGLRRMLVALAQRPQGLSNKQIGIRAGLSSQSGTFSTYLGRARSSGWIDGQGTLRITEAGLAALGDYEPLPTGPALAEYWIGELGGGAARMLRALVDAYPGTLSNEKLGQRAEISHVSGTFSTYLSRMRGLELVEGRGEIRASEELFS